jgi:hypothetical protein
MVTLQSAMKALATRCGEVFEKTHRFLKTMPVPWDLLLFSTLSETYDEVWGGVKSQQPCPLLLLFIARPTFYLT